MNQPEIPSQPAPPAPPNAVERCTQAFHQAYQAKMAKSRDQFEARDLAIAAYRRAMPQLLGAERVRDFIACVANGILLGAIEPKQSSSLLYAAQVALSALHRNQKQKEPKKE